MIYLALPDFSAMFTGSKLERSKGFLQQQRVHLCFQGLLASRRSIPAFTVS
jgi:hypothetical protein